MYMYRVTRQLESYILFAINLGSTPGLLGQ